MNLTPEIEHPRTFVGMDYEGAFTADGKEFEGSYRNNGPFVLRSAYDRLVGLYKNLQSQQCQDCIQVAVDSNAPFTFIGTEPTLRQRIEAAIREANEHGENFGFFGNTKRVVTQPPAVPPHAYPQTEYERKVSESTSFYTEPEDTIRRMFGDTPGSDL